MVRYIDLILSNLLIDILVCLIQKKLFQLKLKTMGLMFIQILNVICGILCMYYSIEFYKYLFIKILLNMVIVLIICNDYRFKTMLAMNFAYIATLFSVVGFASFFVMLFNAIFKNYKIITIEKILNISKLLAILTYLCLLFLLVRFIENKKYLKNFLFKVSFSLFGKHIKINGLLDSGNSLYDTKTKKAVVVVSVYALKKYLSKQNYLKIISGDYSVLGYNRLIEFSTISAKNEIMPVFDVDYIKIYDGEICKKYSCVIGIVNRRFGEGKNYECLIHSKFV